MKKEDKAAGCGDTHTAQQADYNVQFKQFLQVLTAYLMRCAAWCAQIGGGLW